MSDSSCATPCLAVPKRTAKPEGSPDRAGATGGADTETGADTVTGVVVTVVGTSVEVAVEGVIGDDEAVGSVRRADELSAIPSLERLARANAPTPAIRPTRNTAATTRTIRSRPRSSRSGLATGAATGAGAGTRSTRVSSW